MHCRPLVPFLFAAALPCPTLAQSPAAATTPVPGSQLPIVAEHHYSVTGRVRILLWWYSRDDVGLARLRWRAENERRGFELLIASDPARAPRHINQWGYVAEEIGPGGATLLGVGKDTDPKSVEEAKNGVKAEAEAKQFLYKAIRTEVTGATGRTGVIHFALPRDPTYRDLDSVIAQLPASAPSRKEVPPCCPESAEAISPRSSGPWTTVSHGTSAAGQARTPLLDASGHTSTTASGANSSSGRRKPVRRQYSAATRSRISSRLNSSSQIRSPLNRLDSKSTSRGPDP